MKFLNRLTKKAEVEKSVFSFKIEKKEEKDKIINRKAVNVNCFLKFLRGYFKLEFEEDLEISITLYK